jgi:hypothetical protein
MCKTNPIWEKSQVSSVKFEAGEASPQARQIPHDSNIPSFHQSNPMPIVRNEANFRRDGPTMPNEADFPAVPGGTKLKGGSR